MTCQRCLQSTTLQWNDGASIDQPLAAVASLDLVQADGLTTAAIELGGADEGAAAHGGGYLDAALLIEATRDFGVDLFGPTLPDLQWQARLATGFAAAAFQVDWDAQYVTYPRGVKSSGWTASTEFGWETVKVKFSQADCKPCPNRADCAGPTASRRVMTLRDRREFEALQAARKRAPEFRAVHALRAGVEAALSQGVRRFGLRRARYVGLAKTRLQHVSIAAAMNLVRIGDWLAGVPIAPTRRSHFGQLVGLAGTT